MARAGSISGLALGWMILGEWRAHPARAITAAVAAGAPDASNITPETVAAHLQFLCMAALLVA